MTQVDRRDPLIGRWILDQYRIIKSLGTGGMSQVYLAEQPSMGRYAAIKILHAGRTTTPDLQQRFRKEARGISRLSHPNIVTVHNFGELGDGTLYLALEYVQGTSLGALLKSGALPLLRAVNLTYQCAAGLAYAHTRQIVHRDLKPDNIMATRLMGRDHVKILDFGIARLLEEGSFTEPGTIMGTPEYLSPEQCRGEKATPFSDQYALGLVFYAMVTGRVAMASETVLGCIHKQLNETPEPPSRVRPEEGTELLDGIIMKMMAKEPTNRFPSMEKVQEALDEVSERLLAIIKKKQAGAAAAAPPAPPPSSREQAPTEPVILPQPAEGIPAQAAPPPTGLPQRAAAVVDPGVVMVLEAERLFNADTVGVLLRNGVQVVRTTGDGPPPAPGNGPPAADLWLIGAPASRSRAAFEHWKEAGFPPDKTLLCVDAGLDTPSLHELASLARNLLIGVHPVEPMALTLALRWLHRSYSVAIEPLVSHRAVQVLQIASATEKASYLELMMEDLRGEGVRQSTQQAVRELGDEMIMNAIFHAPRADRRGKGLLGRRDLLLGGRGAVLQWSVGQRFVAVSVRDSYGSLSPRDILCFATGPTPAPREQPDRHGAGLGLRIMSRAAQHLFFFLLPGRSSEVMALVEREREADSTSHKSLSVLQGGAQQERRLGNRLWLSEVRHPDCVRLILRGEIEESAELSSLFAGEGLVRLDLSGVTAINSMGIQSWLMASRRRAAGLHLVLERCSYAMVRQFNLLPPLAALNEIVSLYAPYVCPGCSKESMELVYIEELGQGAIPERLCSECGNQLIFEESPQGYFSFLSGTA